MRFDLDALVGAALFCVLVVGVALAVLCLLGIQVPADAGALRDVQDAMFYVRDFAH